MTRRFQMGRLGGVARIRASRPGHDVFDLSLDPRFVAFDSDWRNALRWHAGGKAAGSALTTGIYSRSWLPAGGTGIFTHKVINVPGISPGTHTAIVLARYSGTGTFNNRWYQCGALIENNVLRVCPYLANTAASANLLNSYEYYYWVFAVKPDAPDPAEADLANSILFGDHPTRGAGIFVSRRGTDVLTAADSDLVLSTQKNYFQFHETGTANKAAVITADEQLIQVTLSGSYPSRPPIVVWRSNSNVISPAIANWVNDNTIALRLGIITTGTVTYRWGIIATDPTYPGGTGVRKRRVVRHPTFGFGVTKKGIGVDEAGQDDWIFRSDRLSLQFRNYSTIYPNTFAVGLYSYPADAQATSGTPFTMFQLNIGGSAFVGIGWVSTLAIKSPTDGSPREWLVLASASETQFRVQKDGSISFSGIASYAGVANVANF